MNKYQEALKRLRTNEYLTSREQKEYYNLLQELVDKETPMKVTEKYVHKERDYFEECCFVYVEVIDGYCPNCGEDITENHTYCPHCGQHLDWSDSE